MNRKGLGSVIEEKLKNDIDNPLVFKTLSSDLGHGYDCTILIDVWYGPHECNGCGATIVKSSIESGGIALDAPHGHHYPNHRWVEHRCTAKEHKDTCPASKGEPV